MRGEMADHEAEHDERACEPQPRPPNSEIRRHDIRRHGLFARCPTGTLPATSRSFGGSKNSGSKKL